MNTMFDIEMILVDDIRDLLRKKYGTQLTGNCSHETLGCNWPTSKM
jgi:hypothetical protein